MVDKWQKCGIISVKDCLWKQDHRIKEEDMPTSYSISLEKIIKEIKLNTVYIPESAEKIMVSNPEVDRPGLALAGFYDVFDPSRIQIMGKAETKYLSTVTQEERKEKIDLFASKEPKAIIVSSDLDIYPELLEAVERYKIPLLTTKEKTSHVQASMISWLNVQLAPRITRHGVFVEVYGEGLLLLGESGIGKSETAIELVKRGHRLIADDAVEIKRVSDRKLLGSAPDLIRHYVELRGIGIVDVRRIFGMGAIKEIEQIDLVINLEPWVNGKLYDRFGFNNETCDILGIVLPSLTIPVTPGRNMAIIIEIAAMNHRQKKMGYNTAEEFNNRLMAQLESNSEQN